LITSSQPAYTSSPVFISFNIYICFLKNTIVFSKKDEKYLLSVGYLQQTPLSHPTFAPAMMKEKGTCVQFEHKSQAIKLFFRGFQYCSCTGFS